MPTPTDSHDAATYLRHQNQFDRTVLENIPCNAQLRRRRSCSWMSPPQRKVQIVCSADQSQMGESLREVTERLAAGAGSLVLKAEMMGVAEHARVHGPRVNQPITISLARARQRYDQPEGADIERSLFTF